MNLHSPAPAGRKPRILIVDDDLASRELLEAFLQAEAYAVETAADGNLAIEMTGVSEFHLVILDMHMPLYSGVEVLQLLRRQHVRHRLRIVALTADTSEPTRRALERSGIDGLLSKPIDFQLLRSELNRLKISG